MVDLIVLPPLAHLADRVYGADTPVWRVSSPGKAMRCTLAQAFKGGRTPVLLLHPQDARIAWVKLPRLPAEKLARAAALSLEEQVLTDPQELVVTVGERSGDLVAVCFTDKALLAQLKSTLTQLGHSQAPVGAAAGALKGDAVWLEGGLACIFRAGDCAVVPAEVISLVTTELAQCTVYVSDSDTASERTWPEGWQEKLALPPFTTPSMLFIDRKTRDAARRLWRVPFLLAALCAIAWVLGLTIWWQVLKAEAARRQSAIAQQFAKALPGTPIVDPVVQLQRAAHGGGPTTTFEQIVLAADKAAASLPAQTVLSAEYSGERLTLKLAKDKLTPAVKTQFELAARNARLRINWLNAESVALSLVGAV